MGYDLTELLPIYFASIIKIKDVIAEIVTVFNCMAGSAMERAVLRLVNVGWPRFSFFRETECIIGHKDLKDVSQ